MADEERYVEDIIDQKDNFSKWYNQVVRKKASLCLYDLFIEYIK